MNLPWDKSYFKLCFYIIFTFMVIYIFKNAVDLLVYALINMGGIYRGVLKGARSVFSIFSVIITGFVIAYILNPLADFFDNLFHKRGLSVVSAFFVLIIIMAIVISAVALNLKGESLQEQIELYRQNITKIENMLLSYDIKLPYPKINMYSIGKWGTQLFLGFVISIYFLKDKEKIITNLNYYTELLPKTVTTKIYYVLNRLNRAFSGYVRGQLTDAVIIASLLSLVLSVINIPFAIPVSVISGFLNIIPYFGAIFGLIMAGGITILSGEYLKALYAVIAVFIIQQADAVYISPKIVGESVKLSPVTVIIALAVSANLFGIWGMVLSVPVVSFLKIMAEDYLINKKGA